MSRRVAVIIPNWNGEKFLRTCLTSLRDQSFEDFEIILADGGSTDGSVAFVRESFPEVQVIALGENPGFSGSVNVGIRESRAELVALLNNDTEQDAGWLAALVRAADGHPEAGSFASKLLSFNDHRVLDGAGDALRRSGLPYRIGHGERDSGQFDAPGHVFGACAAAALYRRTMLEEIGLFDEDFFAYCEDGDLSFRAQLAGYRCFYVPDAVVYHVGGASTGGKRSATATRLGTRNSISLLAKDLPTQLVPRLLPSFLAGQPARFLTATVSGVLPAHLSGLAEAARMAPLMLHKRRGIQKRRKVPVAYVRRLLAESSKAARRSLLRRLRDSLLTKAGR